MGDNEFQGPGARPDPNPGLPPKNEILQKIMLLRDAIEVAMRTMDNMVVNNQRSPQYEELELTVADLKITEEKLSAIFIRYPEVNDNGGVNQNEINAEDQEQMNCTSQVVAGALIDDDMSGVRHTFPGGYDQGDLTSLTDISHRLATNLEDDDKVRPHRQDDHVTSSMEPKVVHVPDSESVSHGFVPVMLSGPELRQSQPQETVTSSDFEASGFSQERWRESFLEHLQYIHASIDNPTDRLLTVLAGVRLFFPPEEATEVAQEFFNIHETFWNIRRRADLDYLKRITHNPHCAPDILPSQDISGASRRCQNQIQEDVEDTEVSFGNNFSSEDAVSGSDAETRKIDFLLAHSAFVLNEINAMSTPSSAVPTVLSVADVQTPRCDIAQEGEFPGQYTSAWPDAINLFDATNSTTERTPERLFSEQIRELHKDIGRGTPPGGNPILSGQAKEGRKFLSKFLMVEMQKFFGETSTETSRSRSRRTGQQDPVDSSLHVKLRRSVAKDEEFLPLLRRLEEENGRRSPLHPRQVQALRRGDVKNSSRRESSDDQHRSEKEYEFLRNLVLFPRGIEKRKVKNSSRRDRDSNAPTYKGALPSHRLPVYDNLTRPSLYGHNLSGLPSFGHTFGQGEPHTNSTSHRTGLGFRQNDSQTHQQANHTPYFLEDEGNVNSHIPNENRSGVRREQAEKRDRSEVLSASSTMSLLVNVLESQRREICDAQRTMQRALDKISRMEVEIMELRNRNMELERTVYRDRDTVTRSNQLNENLSSVKNQCRHDIRNSDYRGVAYDNSTYYQDREFPYKVYGRPNREQRHPNGHTVERKTRANVDNGITQPTLNPSCGIASGNQQSPLHSYSQMNPTGVANENRSLPTNSGLTEMNDQRPGYSGASSGSHSQTRMQTLNSGILNNQVPPGNRANNYWDNFRSYSRQNMLSSPKFNGSLNGAAGGAGEHRTRVPDEVNNFNVDSTNKSHRTDGQKSLEANQWKLYMDRRYAENVNGKNRNDEEDSDENEGEGEDSDESHD